MKKHVYRISSFAAGVVLLIATPCIAQTTTSTTKPASAATAQTSTANHQSGPKPGIAVDHAGGNGVQRADGPGSTGTNPLYEPHDKAASNPMHKPKGTAGTNPLYEPKDKTASSAHPKKPTRYRPGNHKTLSLARPRARGK